MAKKKTFKAQHDNWKPIRRGAVYCSPRCGMGCKHKDFLASTARAKKTAKALGPGWEPEVWENMGWHWKAQHGTDLDVYPRAEVGADPDGFKAQIAAGVQSGPHEGASGYVLQFWGSGGTPKEALAAARQEVRNTRLLLTAALERITTEQY